CGRFAGVNDGKPGRVPCREPAEQIRYVGEAELGEHAGSDQGPVAAGAVHDDGQVAVESVERVDENGKGDLDRPAERSVGRLDGGADVDELQVGLQAT